MLRLKFSKNLILNFFSIKIKMKFYKYQGTGNDFIMIDNRNLSFNKSKNHIAQLCHRRFGIGGDGLILLENDNKTNFRMVYFNADGKESTMCGNGGRCIVAFAHFLNIFKEKCTFNAIDGIHEAQINSGIVKLKMIDVKTISQDDNDKSFILNTGSPHLVQYIQGIETYDVYKKGYHIRYSETYKKEGINVNFVQPISNTEIFVRTYERGVEAETLSCGTGVTASALTFMDKQSINEVRIKTLGGNLKVYAEKCNEKFINIWLEGAATQVFYGEIN